MNMMNTNMELLQQLKNNPREFIERAKVNIPEELMNDPKAMVQHLIMSGQVGGPLLQRIMPMIRQVGGR